MLKSVKQQIEVAHADYGSGTAREKWILKWPCEVVMCIFLYFLECSISRRHNEEQIR